jgi:ATP-dependent Clp protease protease subunit
MELDLPYGPEPDETEEEEEYSKASKHIADRLLDSRIVLLAEPVTSELAQDIVGRLLVLDAEDADEPIDVYINSPGGNVDAGFAIYDMMQFINAPVRCVANGLCASAAVVVLLGAAKTDRLSLPNSRFMIHQPSGGAHGSVADIKIEADEILKIRTKINELIARESGQPVEQVEADTRRNRWMDAQEAEAYGLVSRILASKEEMK